MADMQRWNPFRRDENSELARRDSSFQRLQQEMNRLFEDFFNESSMLTRSREDGLRGFSPRVDISEDAESLKISAELPGMSQDDVEITATADSLTIQGEKRSESEEEDEGVFRTERSYGFFKRTIPLPVGADVDGAQATFDNGVLNIRLPKTGESEGRKLEIT